MRIAIISDIHEDFLMLEKALAILKSSGYDILVCLGDITGFAPKFYNHTPDANSCLDALKSMADIVLAGNHDLYSSQRLPTYHLEKNIPENWYELTLKERFLQSNNSLWLYEEEIPPKLTPENECFLGELKEYHILDAGIRKVFLSHFLQPDLLGVGRWFPYRIGELRPHFRLMEEHGCTIAIAGHCHPEGLTIVSKLFWSTPSFEEVRLTNKPRIALCPSVVSNKDTGSCIIFDTVKNSITPFVLRN